MLLQIDEWSLHNVYLDEDTGEWIVPLREDGYARILRFDPVELALDGPDFDRLPDYVADGLERWLVDRATTLSQERFGAEALPLDEPSPA